MKLKLLTIIGSILLLTGCASTLTPTIEADSSSKIDTQVIGHHTIILKTPKTLTSLQESYVTAAFMNAGSTTSTDECAVILQNTFKYPTLPIGNYAVQKKHNKDDTSVTLSANIAATKTNVDCSTVTLEDVARYNAAMAAALNAVGERARCTSSYGNRIC